MNDDRDIVAAAMRSILSALKDDPPADWRDSLYDAVGALTELHKRMGERRAK